MERKFWDNPKFFLLINLLFFHNYAEVNKSTVSLLQDHLRDPELHLAGGVEQGGPRIPGRCLGPGLRHVRAPGRSAALRDIHTQG